MVYITIFKQISWSHYCSNPISDNSLTNILQTLLKQDPKPNNLSETAVSYLLKLKCALTF